MKKIILLSMLALAFGCKKNDIIDGGYSFREIYLLQEDMLVDAQDHVEACGNEGGTIKLEYVSFWIDHIETRKESDGITISYSPSNSTPTEDAFYEKVNEWDNRYKQTVIISISPNHSTKSRKAIFRVITRGGNGHAADLTVKQKGD